MDPPANTEVGGVGMESTVALATLETQGDSQMEVDHQAVQGAGPGPEAVPDARKLTITEETSVLNQTEDETIIEPKVAKKKFLNIEPAETVPKNFAAYLDDSTASEASQEESLSPEESLLKSAPTSVIVTPKPIAVEEAPIDKNGKQEEEPVSQEEEKTPVDEQKSEDTSAPAEPVSLQPPSEELPKELLDLEQEQATVTVADLVEEAEKKEEPTEEVSAVVVSEAVVEEIVNTPEDEKSIITPEEMNSMETPEEEKSNKSQEEDKSVEMEESPLTQNPKAKKSQAVKLAAKAAEIEKDWSDEEEEEEEEGSKVDVTVEAEEEDEKEATDEVEAALKSPKLKLVDDAKTPEFTPRKSGRAPKPTEKKLESQQQENLKTEDMEESVDAIAKELEKTDTEVNKSGKKDSKSPKKGKKGGRQQGENKEDWVTLIFGENGEKVTEKGKKKGAEIDDKDELDIPEAEEFLMDQTPFQSKDKSKKSGRPRKKDLDEKMDGVAKLGSNMYFYTGPGGGQGGREDSPSLSDEEEKSQVESKRKSGRAGKGRNPRLEREDEVVDLPQVKAKEASLNPSWLKNHDGKAPVKKISTAPSTPVTSKTAATAVSNGKKKTSATKEKEEAAVTAAAEEIAAAMEIKEEDPKTPVVKKNSNELDLELPEFDPDKFTPGYVPKTVKKGDDEYMIVVQGVSDTGLCGNYWGSQTGGRRRSKAPETLQLGKAETPTDNSRRGSVGSVSSTDTPTGRKKPQAKMTPVTPKVTPKSHKKQVTKPEKKPEPMDSSQSESEPEPESAKRGRKRKADAEAPAKEAKKEKKEQAVEDEDLKATFSDYDSAGGTENTTPLRTTKRPSSKESPAKDKESKESTLTSKQQTAVNAALAAGVPAGQQRSVSCVADTSTQREVVVECFAPYDDHRWVNIGKERDGMAPDAVQYARALRPPYHLLSFLRIKGHSTKGMSCTDKNTMVFVVLEGEITVILHTTQFNAKKGDSFYIPPKNYYNLINQKAREAELSLIQFQYDGPLPTVQPAPGSS